MRNKSTVIAVTIPVLIIGTGRTRIHKKKIILPNPKRKGASLNGIILISLPIAVKKAINIIVRKELGDFGILIILSNHTPPKGFIVT